MILLNTHIWIWDVSESPQLPRAVRADLEAEREDGLGVSIISCWEVAKLIEYDRLELDRPVGLWSEQALGQPGLHLLDLTLSIAVASTQLPGIFHRDPADQIIVATARVYDLELVTMDRRILNYVHVRTRA